MSTASFPLSSMTEVMGMRALIAAEFGFYLPETSSVYELMHLSGVAEKKRNDRIKAATEGKTYVG